MTHVTIYGTPACGYCKQAIKVCEGSDISHEYIDLSEHPVHRDILEEKLAQPVRSVPQIFVNDTHVGGYMEFLAYLREHPLDT